jgi:hypothetical protein
MLALYATILLVALLFIPGILFRGIFSLFLHMREFQRTRAEEIAFAAKIAVVPLLIAFYVVFGATGLNAYRGNGIDNRLDSAGVTLSSDLWVLYHAAVDDTFLKAEPAWASYRTAGSRVLSSGCNMVLVYYGLLIVEAILLGWFCSQYGALRDRRVLGWFLKKLLVPSISEWYMILTTFAQPLGREVITVADILTTDDHLYHGVVESYHVERDGSLRGILLGSVYRFDRPDYVRAKEANSLPSKAKYWKQIPGQNVYVLSERIANLNVSYESPVAIELKQKLGLDPTLKLDITS